MSFLVLTFNIYHFSSANSRVFIAFDKSIQKLPTHFEKQFRKNGTDFYPYQKTHQTKSRNNANNYTKGAKFENTKGYCGLTIFFITRLKLGQSFLEVPQIFANYKFTKDQKSRYEYFDPICAAVGLIIFQLLFEVGVKRFLKTIAVIFV